MDIWYDKIQTIKQRPGLYIGKKSLTILRFYMKGYMDRQHEIDGHSKRFDFEFQEFIQKYYKIKYNSHHWADIITFFSATDAEAFDKFYELWEEFSQTKDG